MNQLARATARTRLRVSLEPPMVELTEIEAQAFDSLVLDRLQLNGGLAADARVELVREVIAAGLLAVAHAEALEENRRLGHDLAGAFRGDTRFDDAEREELANLARSYSASMAVIQQLRREREDLIRRVGEGQSP